MNREEWLTEAVEKLRPLVKQAGGTVPPTVRVSVGWADRAAKKTLGQCFASHTSKDKSVSVFISPIMDDAIAVLATLTHELIHAADDCKSQHSGEFGVMARAIGLEGKLTATYAGEALKEALGEIAEEIGPYPHMALTLSGKDAKKQTTRMIKLQCADCEYTARTTRKWLEKYDVFPCPCGHELVVPE
jgi:hypothetical protein